MRSITLVVGLSLVPACFFNPPDFVGATETAGTAGPTCGDGVVDPGEQCDDGNQLNGDGCENDCTKTAGERCGDGRLSGDEVCDDGNDIDTDVCTNACKPAVCGDGIILAGYEQCDDGNSDDHDACTNACKLAVCGDGIVESGVEECDDGNRDDTDACLNSCELAVCGDGVVQAGLEECDNGDTNSDAYDGGCTTQCQLGPRCGDGVVQADVEECDDGTPDGDDLCNACLNTPRRYVFVTAATYTGDLGSVFDADDICGAAALQAGLGAKWVAWLTDDTYSALTRMDTKYPGWYALPGDPDVPVAKGWSGLASGALLHPINRTETGETLAPGELAWANTSPKGGFLGLAQHCDNWTVDFATKTGRIGDPHATDTQWTDKADPNTASCDTPLHLYCVEN